MSTDTERVEDGTESSVLAAWDDWYHLPVIGAVMLFMIWVRTQAYENVALSDGNPRLGGIDSWYHWRTIQWTADNYPRTMPYDVWTGFPTGRYVGQFGTLYDQLIVTAAMIVGLGDPSTETLYTVSVFMEPVFAALVAIPVFYMGRRLGGTIGGLVSVLLLALAPGQFLSRSLVGQLQHHVAEVLFMAVAVLAMMVALRAAERDEPIYELVVDQDWEALRAPAIYSALAGLALTLYIWVWPPAVVLIGIFAVFFTVQLCLDYVRGISPDHVAFVGAVALGVTTLLTAVLIEDPGTSVTSFSYIQPVSAALVAGGCVFMAWLARQWNQRGLDRRYYPGAIAALIAAAFLVMWLVLPDLFATIVNNLTQRVVPFGDAGTNATIQEAQSPDNFATHAFEETGAAFYTMIIGLGLLVARSFFDRQYRAEYTLLIVWALFLTSMAATQIRFGYYLVLPVAVVNAAFVADAIRLFDLDIRGGIRSVRALETYQVIVALVIVMLLFAPLLPPIATATVVDRGSSTGPHPDSLAWEDSNHWLQENTPEPGNWAGADNADELEFYGTHEFPEDGDYDYPEGAYGVMSWWDYGHLITTQGERIPHANPFQQNARPASAYLTAGSEERGELILDAIAAGESPSDESNEQLEAMAENASHEEMRYVMIDDQMAGGKFTAISQWTEPSTGTYFDRQQAMNDQSILTANENYDDTMVASLYRDDADGLEQYRLVHESSWYSVVGNKFEVHEPSGQVIPQATQSDRIGSGGWDANKDTAQQIEAARENGQIVPFDSSGARTSYYHDAEVEPSIKTFERVAGATITGSVDDGSLDENATVTASVDLETNTNRTFTYTQEAELGDDGAFELTVPYATNDELGVDDGYTNSSVEATDDYTVTVETADGNETQVRYEGQVDVPETAVVDGETVDVDLEEVDDSADDASDENASDDASGDGETDDETDESNGSETTGETNDTAESIAPLAADPTN